MSLSYPTANIVGYVAQALPAYHVNKVVLGSAPLRGKKWDTLHFQLPYRYHLQHLVDYLKAKLDIILADAWFQTYICGDKKNEGWEDW